MDTILLLGTSITLVAYICTRKHWSFSKTLQSNLYLYDFAITNLYTICSTKCFSMVCCHALWTYVPVAKIAYIRALKCVYVTFWLKVKKIKNKMTFWCSKNWFVVISYTALRFGPVNRTFLIIGEFSHAFACYSWTYVCIYVNVNPAFCELQLTCFLNSEAY